MKFFLEGRILDGIRLFLFSAFVGTSVFAGAPVTTEGRVNRNAFPIARFAGKFDRLPGEVEAELRARIDQALAPVKLAPTAWFRASLPILPDAGDRRKILESYLETEIWKCEGTSCENCAGDESSGCILGNNVAGGVGVVAVIHPCLYGEGKCFPGAPSDLGEWIEKFVLGVAYDKAGLPKSKDAFRKALRASGSWIAATSRAVNQMIGACPGPYSAESLKFLFNLDAISLPNAAIMKCGQTYLEEFRGLPAKCKLLRGPLKEEWTVFEKAQLRASTDILRCDAYCQKMLCRPKGVSTVFTRFSGKPALLIGDGACEGETPKARGKFLREALPRNLRGKLEESACLPPIEGAASLRDGTSGLGNGPEVQLVE